MAQIKGAYGTSGVNQSKPKNKVSRGALVRRLNGEGYKRVRDKPIRRSPDPDAVSDRKVKRQNAELAKRPKSSGPKQTSWLGFLKQDY